MAEFEWQPDDVRDLVRRDLVKSVQLNSPFPVATPLLSLWLMRTSPAVGWSLSCSPHDHNRESPDDPCYMFRNM
jgi:hypothetical protein